MTQRYRRVSLCVSVEGTSPKLGGGDFQLSPDGSLELEEVLSCRLRAKEIWGRKQNRYVQSQIINKCIGAILLSHLCMYVGYLDYLKRAELKSGSDERSPPEGRNWV